ncbi:sugar phosphate isomerase/epimerase [Zobellia galactanivorans]|uniref:TIM-barrel fold protein n=1 Tax=Zobellia galactanivorans (strain DSM 12802 / CCUG 47099 / CIP 106680 / NCIMB 13871 / Dsij) TaxID=63186 RepID=G0LA34_ZOBGA|nr:MULTISPECIES: sugar phosphate isomerase/epimerase [Zobellia]MDO6810851.1 sugar phosphate isomerase/epimerase [Zobellia galactanivorans]OWW26124.1 xylose isomerase [Zobellia sp. OII3]CAZ95014.1 TIM-barrel fold protein [Zobellia galactanivorans]
MRMPLTLVVLLFSFIGLSQKKQLQFFQTDWGRQISWDAFCEKTKAAGYDGIETWFPRDKKSQNELKTALEKYDLKVGFLNGTNKSIPFKESLKQYTAHFKTLVSWNPVYINCHTGSDFFTFEQNKAFIDAANKIAKESNIPIYHETHRGRFSFNLPDTKKYLSAIPELKLNLDISHWMVVHESLLQNQDKELEEIVNRSHHIHARVGHAEGPQVNDPEAPEWKKAVERHMDIWEKVIRKQWEGKDVFTITTEFGPADYMPTLPYTQLPVADQWKANVYMMKLLKERFNID